MPYQRHAAVAAPVPRASMAVLTALSDGTTVANRLGVCCEDCGRPLVADRTPAVDLPGAASGKRYSNLRCAHLIKGDR
ncbi:MAG: hypothetical protein M3300_00665 [Actinomycetota bacterium]|nr:hypothetical protein [Actinomycetota bacterium]